ncbi:MAG: hypothetical protein L0387_17580, partial [Acidobacteria bacterium]|nr:hypothetical protein [Acidobacteriota bacterium]
MRAVWSASTSTYRTYTFSYSADAFPHLTAINNWIGTSETYALNYTVNQPLVSPFAPNPALGSAKRLNQVVDATRPMQATTTLRRKPSPPTRNRILPTASRTTLLWLPRAIQDQTL